MGRLPLDIVRIAGTTARLTRLVTTDFIGQWWVQDPVDRAMARYEAAHSGEEEPWWWRYRAGLTCPHCLGFWIGAGVLASYAVAGRTRSWRYVADALTLSYVIGHVSARLDVTEEDE